jgi:hypothetical protein
VDRASRTVDSAKSIRRRSVTFRWSISSCGIRAELTEFAIG